MSVFISSAVWKISSLSSTQKFVFISLADQANDEGICYPTIRSISKRTSLSDRAIRAAIKHLEKNNFLRVEKVPGRASNYVLTPVGDAAPNHETGSVRDAGGSVRDAGGSAGGAGQLETPFKRQLNKKYKKEILESSKRLLDFFNSTCSKHHRGDASIQKIAKVLEEGFSEQECRSVIVRKWRDWKDDDDMKKYLRIGTIFRPSNFSDYIGEIPKETNYE